MTLLITKKDFLKKKVSTYSSLDKARSLKMFPLTHILFVNILLLAYKS